MTTPHNITAIEGQTYLIPLRLLDAHGQPAPLAAYDIYGAVRVGDKPAAMAVQQADSSSCILSIHPLPEGAYAYDLFARQRSTGAEVRLLRGTVTAQRRTATLPPATGAGEEVTLTLSADTTALTVTVSPIVASTPGAVEALETANALLAASMQQADDLVPAARAAIAQEGAAASALVQQSATSGQQQIAAAVGDGKADIAGAVDAGVFEVGEAATEGVGNIIDTAARKTDEAAAAITAKADTAKADIHAAAVRDAAAALDLIDAATAKGTDTLDQSVISGTDALNASTTSGKQQIAAATTSGTGTINQTVTNGMALLDGYVGTVSDDLARKSQPNIWGGVNTYNGALVANGGIIAGGQDLIKTIYTAALMDALYCDTAAGWTDKYAGATSGSGYNSLHYGTESSTSYLGKTASGILTRTDYTHQMVCKHLAIFGNDCMAGITAVVNLDSNAFWGTGNQLTGYCFGQAMQTHADVPFDRMIDPEYTPNVGGTPTVMFSAAPNEQVRVDIYYSTIHRQVIVPKIANVTQRSYRQTYVIIWTPTRFMVHLLPAYPATDWRCIARIDARNMSSLYRTNIIGWQDTNSFRVNISLSAHSLNTYAAAGYGDWMQPLIHITA